MMTLLKSWIVAARKTLFRRIRKGPQPRRLRLQWLERREVPATFYVDSVLDSGTDTLRDAITQLNTSMDANNTIDIVCHGTTTLESALPSIQKNVTIQGPGYDNFTVTRDSTAAPFTIFSVAATAQVSIDDITISGGNAGALRDGGGIFNQGGLSLNNDVLTGNKAKDGGGIFNDVNAQLQLTNVSMYDNHANFNGGAIENDGNMGIVDSQLYVNWADLGNGGALYLAAGSTTSVFNSNIYSNTARADGGGIDDEGGTVTWSGGLFTGNHATTGGGIAEHAASQGTLSGLTIQDNTADINGGGFYLAGANTNLDFSNSTITNNHSGNQDATSAGAYQAGTTYSMTNCTISGNIAQVQ
jgi:hypothetical protein